MLFLPSLKDAEHVESTVLEHLQEYPSADPYGR